MKAGIKTSEFWVMLIVSNIMIFAKQLGWELAQCFPLGRCELGRRTRLSFYTHQYAVG